MNDPTAETAKCFVPEMLMDFIDRNMQSGKEGLEPSSFFLHGVCLLVDISGFTKLSGDFCKMGKAGIDELQLATNGYMGKLVETIYMFGGEIIKFAGDAIICVFASNFVTGLAVDKNGSTLRRSLGNFGELLQGLNTTGQSSRSTFLSPFNSTKTMQHPQAEPEEGASVTQDVVLRAMYCASVLREIQTEKLSVHVAMSCGEMCFGILGGVENRWECLISGPCIHELSDCLDDAPSKTAVISAEGGRILARSAMKHAFGATKQSDRVVDTSQAFTFQVDPTTKYDFELLQLPSGNQHIVSVTCSKSIETIAAGRTAQSAAAQLESERLQGKALNMIQQFVPIPVANAAESGLGLEFIAEIREVTTMFMKWDSYDSTGKHRDLLSLQTAFYRAQEALLSTGAYLRQFLVDDKGCVLIGCWGMPHLSHLDNASRALSAAARIRSQLNELHMECSFGITTGDVYCGTVGSALRMEYAAIGSVVNIAARLMCKAHGGILIDDATHDRLEPGLKELTKALEPIKVKGREEPLEVFSYDSIEMVHVKEKVVEDHEISAPCREALLNVLAHLIAPDEVSYFQRSPAKPQASHKNLLDWLNTAEHSTSISTTRRNAPLRVVIVKGKEGSGRTSAVRWLQKKAQDHGVPVYAVRVTRRDCLKDFFLWKRLFQMMAPKNIFVSNETQRTYVKTLLEEIYPGNPHVAHNTGFPLLRSILGITCTYTDGAEEGQSHKVVGLLRPKEGSETRQQVHDFLYRVFSYLLKLRPSLFIIENIEGAHEPSLNLLLDLIKANKVHAGIVMTALENTTGSEATAHKISTFHARASYRWDLLNSTPWSKYAKSYLESCKFAVTITLENLPFTEVNRLLCVAMNVRVVAPEISQLVQDFSGGSYFWVHEILQFITDYGAEQFLTAMDRGDSGSTMAESASMKPRLKPGISMNGTLFGANAVKNAPSAKHLSKALSLPPPGSRRSTNPSHVVQLNKLILCRFENLSADEQRALRTASIIGVDCPMLILHKVLAGQLRESLADCLETLLNQRWLFQDQDNDGMYHFANAHAHRTIYDLTPSSERARLHQQIADHMEVVFKSDRKQYAQLSFHYQQCKSDKALVYLGLAFPDLLLASLIYDLSDCLDLLTGAVPCCKSAGNVNALLKLIDRAEARIQALNVPKRQRWSVRVFLALISCSCTQPSAAVAPSDNFDTFGAEAEDIVPEGQPASDQAGRERDNDARIKRMFLLQLRNLRAQLVESRETFAAE